MTTSDCEKWWFDRKKPLNPMEPEAARCRHESRQHYVGLIGGNSRPRYILDITGGWVSVSFMDRHLRQYLCYNFKETQPGRLFLKSAYYWDYEKDSDRVVSTKIFSFAEDGRIVMEERISATGEIRELETTASVDENWEPYPSFGDYITLCTEDRKLVGCS